MNKDQHLDLLVANRQGNTVSVLLGNGDGSFRALAPVAVGNAPQAVAMGDVNEDGHADLVVADMKMVV